MPRCRNNSAWNQRFYVVSHCGGFTGEVARREVTYTLRKIDLVTRNESAWNYLRVGRLFL
jgi:protein farnesyltransferase/geranylgeranyltransferase type-1 subunit alpha